LYRYVVDEFFRGMDGEKAGLSEKEFVDEWILRSKPDSHPYVQRL
jgi:hypothetical protein